jgi:hypothetical protein
VVCGGRSQDTDAVDVGMRAKLAGPTSFLHAAFTSHAPACSDTPVLQRLLLSRADSTSSQQRRVSYSQTTSYCVSGTKQHTGVHSPPKISTNVVQPSNNVLPSGSFSHARRSPPVTFENCTETGSQVFHIAPSATQNAAKASTRDALAFDVWD